MTKQTHSRIQNSRRGFTVLFSVLTSAVLLSIAISVYTLTMRESRISGNAESSTQALLAANMGLDCALAADTYIPKPFENWVSGDFTTALSQNCFILNSTLNAVEPNLRNGSGGSFAIRFPNTETFTVLTSANQMIASYSTLPCAEVTITKDFDLSSNPVTTIVSKGLNICNSSDSFQVERTLEFTYTN